MPAQHNSDGINQQCAQRILAACRKIIDYIRPAAYELPVEYLEKTVSLTHDVTSAASGLIDIRNMTPYLVDIVNYFALRGKHRLTVQAVEQCAKSTSWKLGLIWRQKFMPSPAGIIYQNKEVGKNIIQDSLLPLMRCDEEFSRALPERAGEAPKRLNLPFSVVYLMTGDGAIISYPMGVIIGDEINKWRMEKAQRKRRKKSDGDYQVSKIKDMDKRTRTFPDSLRVLVCSPEGAGAPISTEYDKSSRGVWHCRCAGCGKLVFDSTAPEQYFRYGTTDSGDVIPETIELVCPECGFSHDEQTHKRQINVSGAYIHELPERFEEHAGFCFGALASQMPGVDWRHICSAIAAGNRDNSFESQAYLYNSIKGLPYIPEVVTGDKISVIKSHYTGLPDVEVMENIAAVYMGVDTQEVGYWFSIEAIDVNNNWYTLDYGFAWDDDTVVNAWNSNYCGLLPMAGIIDEGGHRKPDVDALVDRLGSGFYKYKGEGRSRDAKAHYRISAEDSLLILCQAKYYQKQLLYQIYSQNKKENAYWHICCEMKKTYLYQMAAVQPPQGVNRADYEAWESEGRQHDLFDAKKMTIALHDFAVNEFPAGFFKKAPAGMLPQEYKVV